MNEVNDRAKNHVRFVREGAQRFPDEGAERAEWEATRELWNALGHGLCDECLDERSSCYEHAPDLLMGRNGMAYLCDDCATKRREKAGLCLILTREHPQPCTAERKCDDCCEDNDLCVDCRKREVGNVVNAPGGPHCDDCAFEKFGSAMKDYL